MKSGWADVLKRLLSLNPAILESAYKDREAALETRVEPPLALRLDGVGFGKALAGFREPRDERVHIALLDAAAVLLERLNGLTAYVASDEINLVIMESPPYGGRLEKLVSISAGIASSIVSTRLGRILFFDSRIIPLDDEHDAQRYMYYRARVALNNYVNSMLVKLGVKIESLESGLEERLRMLQALGVDPLREPWASLGSCVSRITVQRCIGNLCVERRRIVAVDGPCHISSSSKETR